MSWTKCHKCGYWFEKDNKKHLVVYQRDTVIGYICEDCSYTTDVREEK